MLIPTGLSVSSSRACVACRSSSTPTGATCGSGGGPLPVRRLARRWPAPPTGWSRTRRTPRAPSGSWAAADRRAARRRPASIPSDRRGPRNGASSTWAAGIQRKGYAVAAQLADTLAGPWLRDIGPDEVPGLIAAHDVVLVPSMAEPFGLVAVEAIASGRWVVARAVGGLRDIVIDGVNGTLVADGDFAGALARVPDYDPYEVARTRRAIQPRAMAGGDGRIWDEVAPPSPAPASD